MSSKRTVSLKLTTQRDLMKHETSARTFGELKEELFNVNFNGVKVIERSRKVTLEADDAILPATNFMLFLVPSKVKSGALEHLGDIENASYNDLRSHGSYLNRVKSAYINLEGNVETLRTAISNYYAIHGTKKETNVVEVLENARLSMNDIFDELVEAIQNENVVDDSKYVIKTTMEDLNKEIDEIRGQLEL